MIPTNERISKGDPDARFYKKKNGQKSKLGYQTGFSTDIKHGIITRVITIPGCDNMTESIKPLIENIVVPELTLDGEFSAGELISLAQGKGVIFNVPIRKAKDVDVYPKSSFNYDYDLDAYICPEGKVLNRVCNTRENVVYRGTKKVCNNCPKVSECTKSEAKIRGIERNKYELELELHQEYVQSDRYQFAKVLRGIIAEGKFAEANNLYRLNIARYVGKSLMHAQAQMTAVVMNLKRLIKVIRKRNSLKKINHPISRYNTVN